LKVELRPHHFQQRAVVEIRKPPIFDLSTGKHFPLLLFRADFDAICSAPKALARRASWRSIGTSSWSIVCCATRSKLATYMFRTAPGFAASRITSSTMRGGTTKTRCCRSTRRCSSPIEETLPGLRDEIEARFVSVNKRIEDGSNKHIKITGVGAKRR